MLSVEMAYHHLCSLQIITSQGILISLVPRPTPIFSMMHSNTKNLGTCTYGIGRFPELHTILVTSTLRTLVSVLWLLISSRQPSTFYEIGGNSPDDDDTDLQCIGMWQTSWHNGIIGYFEHKAMNKLVKFNNGNTSGSVSMNQHKAVCSQGGELYFLNISLHFKALSGFEIMQHISGRLSRTPDSCHMVKDS